MVKRTQKTKITIKTENKAKKSAKLFLTLLNCWNGFFRDNVFVLSASFPLVKTSSSVEKSESYFH